MKTDKRFGWILIGIWFIAFGTLTLIGHLATNVWLVFNIYTIVTGILVIVGIGRVKGLENIGLLVFAIWLIIWALMRLIQLDFSGSQETMLILTATAGILVFISSLLKGGTERIGRVFTGVWLMVFGLFPLIRITFNCHEEILAVLAIVAGVLVLIEK